MGPPALGAEMLAAGVLALLVSAVLGEHWGLPASPRVWWAWVYLVLFGSVIGFSAYRFVVERVSTTPRVHLRLRQPAGGPVRGMVAGK